MMATHPATLAQKLIAIFPGGTVRAVAHALDQYFAMLRKEGCNAGNRDRMIDFGQLNEWIGRPEMLAIGRNYAE